jgi:hypothetical protein
MPGARTKVVEPPPGPPVLSTLLAEIYGPDDETRRQVAGKVRDIFKIPFIVDVDDSFGTQRPTACASRSPTTSSISSRSSTAMSSRRSACSMAAARSVIRIAAADASRSRFASAAEVARSA